MKKKIVLDDIQRIYQLIQKDILHYSSKGKIDKVYHLVDTYSVIVQTINDHFRDDFIETVLKNIANDYLYVSDTNSKKDDKRIVFYDQIGTTICLGLQYLRALHNLGYEIIYIFECPTRKLKSDLFNEVKSYCAEVHVFEGKSTIELAREIRKIILDSNSSKLISHCSAEGSLGASVFYSLDTIEKYRIVPGDHHFNIGLDSYNHFFDYRDFAVKVSVENRLIPINKIHKLPYYPIIENDIPFQGFPEETKGKTIIMAAGSEYKFHGSNWFYDFSKKLLEDNLNAVIVFLGGKSSQIAKFVKSNNLEHRFILLGYRQDFVSCMKNVDIFLNSYPMGGGLVGLTAINLGVPVLSHYDEYNGLQNSLRSFLGAEDVDSPISFADDLEMHQYANKLILDKQFRMAEGLRMKSMAQTKNRFEMMLNEILLHNKYVVERVTDKSCHLDKRLENYLQLQNQFSPSILNLLIKEYGLMFFIKFGFLGGFIVYNFRIIIGWLLGVYSNRFLPDALYFKLKKSLKKYFE